MTRTGGWSLIQSLSSLLLFTITNRLLSLAICVYTLLQVAHMLWSPSWRIVTITPTIVSGQGGLYPLLSIFR